MLLSRFTSRQKIAFFLALVVGFFLFLLSATIIVVNHYQWTNQEIDEVKSKILTLSQKDPGDLRNYIYNNSELDLDGESIYWRDDRGFDLVSGVFKKVSFRKEKPVQIIEVESLDDVGGGEILDSDKDRFFAVIMDTKLGRIGFAENVNQYLYFEQNLILISILVFVVLLLFSLILGFWAADLILKPVRQIISITEKSTLNNLCCDIPISGKKEDVLVQLSMALNDLFKRIREASSKMKQFNHDVSHELKIPLAIIRSDIELALKKGSVGSLENTLCEISSMSKLIDELLFLAQESHKIKLEKFDSGRLKEIVLKTAESLRRVYLKRKIGFVVDMKGKFVFKANEDLLKNLISNLLQNSYKFCLDDGEIRVRISNSELMISNTAEKINPDDLRDLFQVFYKNEKSRSSEGYGIGLSVVKKICDLMGWRIELDQREGEFVVNVRFS